MLKLFKLFKLFKLSICGCTLASMNSVVHANESAKFTNAQFRNAAQSKHNVRVIQKPTVKRAIVSSMMKRKRIRIAHEPITVSTEQNPLMKSSRYLVIFNHKFMGRTRIVAPRRKVHASIPNLYTD